MNPLQDSDWTMLEEAARGGRVPRERVTLLRHRLARASPRPGSPWTLLVGRADAGIELVLARHFDPSVADALKAAGDRPLIIGRAPDQVRPALGTWPTTTSNVLGEGHVIALRTSRPPSPELFGQLQALGYFDQMVLVTRLAGPLHEQERLLASTLSSVAATVRVLIVGLAGEEPTENDLAEVVAYAQVQMRQAGYAMDRQSGADVWFSSGKTLKNTLPRLDSVFVVDAAKVASARLGMDELALRRLLAELKSQAEAQPPGSDTPIADQEKARLAQEFLSYLKDLELEIRKVFLDAKGSPASLLRSFVVDTFQGWGAYSGPEGFWLKYVERLRPGTHVELMNQVKEAVGLLDWTSQAQAMPEAKSISSPPNWSDRTLVEAKRLAAGLIAGVLANQGLHAFLTGAPGLFVRWIGYAGFILAGLLGYGASRPFFANFQESAPAASPKTRVPILQGWAPFLQRLTGWLAVHLTTEPASPLEKIETLLNRLTESENRS